MLVGIPALSFTSCGTLGKIIQLQKKKKKMWYDNKSDLAG